MTRLKNGFRILELFLLVTGVRLNPVADTLMQGASILKDNGDTKNLTGGTDNFPSTGTVDDNPLKSQKGELDIQSRKSEAKKILKPSETLLLPLAIRRITSEEDTTERKNIAEEKGMPEEKIAAGELSTQNRKSEVKKILKPSETLLLPSNTEQIPPEKSTTEEDAAGENILEHEQSQISPFNEALQPNFYYTIFEKLFCSYYLNVSSPFMDRRRKFTENCFELASHENITSKFFDEIFVDEIKNNVKEKKKADSTEFLDFVGVSMLYKELSRIRFFDFLSYHDLKTGRSFDFLELVLAELKKRKARNTADFMPFTELLQSFKKNYNELVKKMASLKKSNPLPEFETAVERVALMCGFKSRQIMEITRPSSAPDTASDNPDSSRLNKVLREILKGNFIPSMKSQLARIDNYFIYLSKSIDELKTDKLDPYSACYTTLYDLTSDFIAIRSLVDLIISIDSFDSKSFFSLDAIRNGIPVSTERLSLSITDCAIALFMNAVGDNERYFALKEVNFSKKNIDWWFNNKVSLGLPIKNLGKINENVIYTFIISQIDKIELALAQIESKKEITDKQYKDISDKIDSLKNLINVIPFKKYSMPVNHDVADFQRRVDNLKDTYGIVKKDEKK